MERGGQLWGGAVMGGAEALLRGAGAVLRGAGTGGTIMGWGRAGGDRFWLGEERSGVRKAQGEAPEQGWEWVSSELG